jgi:hypothetical protein
MGERRKIKQEATHDSRIHPAKNTRPRGNQEVDPRRVDLGREDLSRIGAN